MKTGCQAIQACLQSVDMAPGDIDFLIVCTSTGYVCPDLGSRLIGHMGFRHDIQRASMLGLGCGGALPTLQRACDFVRAYPGRRALMLAVEICSACYFVDSSMETVVGNAICADGAAAFVLGTASGKPRPRPAIVDFQSCIDPARIDKVGFEHRDGKLRIVLATEVRDVASALIERALDPLLKRNGLSRSDIRFWVAHPGGRKVIDKIQQHFKLTDSQLAVFERCFAKLRKHIVAHGDVCSGRSNAEWQSTPGRLGRDDRARAGHGSRSGVVAMVRRRMLPLFRS